MLADARQARRPSPCPAGSRRWPAACYAFLLPGFVASGARAPFSPAFRSSIVAIAIIGGIGIGRRSDHGRAVGGRAPGGLRGQRHRAAAHRRTRPDDPAPVLPRRIRAGAQRRTGLLLGWTSGRPPTAAAPPRRHGGAHHPRRAGHASRAADDCRGSGPAASPSASAAWSPSTTSPSTSSAARVVGLIGTNGAGKSTLMNAISGFVPHDGIHRACSAPRSSGTRGPPPPRASASGRAFQDARLFADRSPFARPCRSRSKRVERSLLIPSLLALPPSPGSERTQASGGRRDHRLPRPRPVRRRVHRRPVDGHAADRRARLPARHRRQGAPARRADRRRRPARDRGVRVR